MTFFCHLFRCFRGLQVGGDAIVDMNRFAPRSFPRSRSWNGSARRCNKRPAASLRSRPLCASWKRSAGVGCRSGYVTHPKLLAWFHPTIKCRHPSLHKHIYGLIRTYDAHMQCVKKYNIFIPKFRDSEIIGKYYESNFVGMIFMDFGCLG